MFQNKMVLNNDLGDNVDMFSQINMVETLLKPSLTHEQSMVFWKHISTTCMS